MAELLIFKFRRARRSESWDDRSASNLAITFERIEIFWILDKILKGLIKTDRMVPLLRVYDVDLVDFKNFNEKKRIEKKNVF